MTTILLGSDNTSARERWKQILQDKHTLLEVASGQELLAILQQQTMNLILLHRSMIDLDFLTHINGVPVFVLSDLPDDEEAYFLLRNGAIGYANTYISAVRLHEAVHIALSGKVWVGQKLMQKIIAGTMSAIHQQGLTTPLNHNLSDREWEVALRVSKGQSNLTIAAGMDISERTVKAHISSIFKKTHTESRLQLALHIKALLSLKSPQA
jgi:DNA-binding NarL/FixJ family response regulator